MEGLARSGQQDVGSFTTNRLTLVGGTTIQDFLWNSGGINDLGRLLWKPAQSALRVCALRSADFRRAGVDVHKARNEADVRRHQLCPILFIRNDKPPRGRYKDYKDMSLVSI